MQDWQFQWNGWLRPRVPRFLRPSHWWGQVWMRVHWERVQTWTTLQPWWMQVRRWRLLWPQDVPIRSKTRLRKVWMCGLRGKLQQGMPRTHGIRRREMWVLRKMELVWYWMPRVPWTQSRLGFLLLCLNWLWTKRVPNWHLLVHWDLPLQKYWWHGSWWAYGMRTGHVLPTRNFLQRLYLLMWKERWCLQPTVPWILEPDSWWRKLWMCAIWHLLVESLPTWLIG